MQRIYEPENLLEAEMLLGMLASEGVTARLTGEHLLGAIGECSRSQGITVLGTCQDSVLVDAAAYCGELLYFEYASKSDVLNHPVRAFGFDPNGDRVRLTADQLISDRPLV